jgi:TonB family protein
VLQDRRRHTRQLITPPPYVALNSSTSGGILTDVSEGGIALTLLGPPVSDDVLLDLQLSVTDEHFQTKGQITWRKDSERKVGLKFVDLTESSLLQIKKCLANAPVTAELKQSLQSERNTGTNVRDTETAEAAGSRAVALNHEELETTAQPTELHPMEGVRQDTKTETFRISNPNGGLHTGRKEPATNAPETEALEASPAVTSGHSPELMPEIKESSAKKRFAAWANDGVRVKVKTLEALLTETPRVHADISKPTQRRERKEPVTPALETQLSDAPGSASVRILPSDRLLQKKSLAKHSVDFEPNVPIQDYGRNGPSVEERQLEKMAEPPALGTIGGVTKMKSAAADVREPNAALFAAASPGFRTEKKALTIEEAAQARELPASSADALKQGDTLAQTLRTSFAKSELRKVRSPSLEQKTEEVAINPGVLRRWILASVVIFLLIVLLAAARRIYTSPIFDRITSASDLREMIAGVSSSANGPQTSEIAHGVDLKTAERQSRQEKGKSKSAEMRTDGTNMRGPRRRKSSSQVSTTAKAPPTLGETNQVSEAKPIGLQTQQQVGTQVGHVSLLPAANLPEKIILPAYPAVAWQKNVQGRVTLKALISKDGRLRNIRLVGPRSLFSGSVLEAVKKWRYQPRMENGTPVEVETQIAIDFER